MFFLETFLCNKLPNNIFGIIGGMFCLRNIDVSLAIVGF
jgi:hypothetical protein